MTMPADSARTAGSAPSDGRATPRPKRPALRRGGHPQLVRWAARALVALAAPLTRRSARWPRFVTRAMTKQLGNFPRAYLPGAGDVLVCSYFKSGTNWTLQIATQIAYRGRAEFAHIHDVVPWPDIPDRMRYAVPLEDDGPLRASPTGLRVIKTHLPLGPVPYSESARYVCVVRDPKDVFVSSYHFTRAIGLGALMPSVEGWLDAFLSPDAALGSWAAHLHSFWSVRDRPNVQFLTYEAMREDLPAAVDAIASVMGVALAPEERAAVTLHSSFTHMKTIEHKFDARGSPWAEARGAMIRRGERGASDELLTAEQQRRIDDYWRAELARLGSDFPYDEAFGRPRRGRG